MNSEIKIAVTDFDGTLSPFKERIPDENIKAIHKWRSAGNKFGIATGRCLDFIEFDLKNYDITLDFLICVNGAVVFNKNREILHSVTIPIDVMKEFIKLPLVKDSGLPLIVLCERNSYSIRPYPEVPADIVPTLTLEEAAAREDVVQFGIRFETVEDTVKAIAEIQKDFPMLGGNPNRNYLDINIKPVDKKYGIERLLELMHWQDNQIFVIGDDINDLPMIKHFKGFTVKNAAPLVRDAALKIYNSVGEMLIEQI